ncbi:hypothetical protein B484DRAFT_141881 [Ochromonadaceae sp. CCMP2298]|nr:hypothetical protein B484DRAFT_141881 [Ochromonadaceae sp. CCMP2298]
MRIIELERKWVGLQRRDPARFRTLLLPRITAVVLLLLLLLLFCPQAQAATDYECAWAPASVSAAGAWSAVASSSTGAVISAAIKGGGIYTSTNGGDVYSGPSGPVATQALQWSALAMSSSGVDQIASTDNSVLGQIWYSDDSGATWTASDAANFDYVSLTMSSDGTKAVAGSTVGLYYSTDKGVTWLPSTGQAVGPYYALAYDVARTHLIAAHSGGRVYTSSDNGVNFATTSYTPTHAWAAIAWISSTSYVVAAVTSGGVYWSTDGGNSFTASDAPNTAWTALTLSSSGQVSITIIQYNTI